MKLTLVIGLVVVGAILAVGGVAWLLGFGASSEPDRVVGVLLKCEATSGALSESPRVVELNGDTCNASGRRNQRYEITVRTANGQTYTAEVSPDASVVIGQTWP